MRDVAEAIRRVARRAARRRSPGRSSTSARPRNNVRIKNLAYRVRDLVPGTEIVMAPTDPDLRDYNVGFDRMGELLDFRPTPHASKTASARCSRRCAAGAVDPDDRRWYTLRQYQFLADVERTFNDVAMDGRVLS